MGKQIATVLLGHDYAEVETAIRRIGEVSILSRLGHSTEAMATLATLSLPSTDLRSADLTVYLVRPSDIKYVRIVRVAAQNTYAISPASPRIVEFTRSYFNGTVLREGRLYVDLTGADKEGKHFLEWATQILDQVRKVLHQEKVLDYPVYIGSSARQWIAESGASWAPGRKELIIPNKATRPVS